VKTWCAICAGRSLINNVEDMKYEIMFHYEGYGFYVDYDNSTPRKTTRRQFDSVDEAVKFAVGCGYSVSFIIVSVAWEPADISKLKGG
jgi:hypothetical protein